MRLIQILTLFVVMVSFSHDAFGDFCSDTDAGDTTQERGVVEYLNSSTNGQWRQLSDSCSSGNVLEYWCICQTGSGQRIPCAANTTGQFSSQLRSCSYSCSNGTCYRHPAGCFDFDLNDDPNIKGKVQFAENTSERTVTKMVEDICDIKGLSVQQYGCDGNTFKITNTTACQNGCYDGACIVPTQNKNGCYLTIGLRETKGPSEAIPSLFTLNGVKTFVGRGYSMSHRLNGNENSPISIVVKDGSGVTLFRYELISARYYTVDGIRESTGATLPTGLESAVNSVTIPFDKRAAKYIINVFGTETLLPITTTTLICANECIATRDVGKEGVDVCCAGLAKEIFAPTLFMCNPSPSPSPQQSVSP